MITQKRTTRSLSKTKKQRNFIKQTDKTIGSIPVLPTTSTLTLPAAKDDNSFLSSIRQAGSIVLVASPISYRQQTMSNTKYPPPDHHHHNVVYKKHNHHRFNLDQRNDSDDEIDVFEATKYFAAGASSNVHQKSNNNSMIRYRDDQQPAVGRRSRISLDSVSPFRNNQSFSASSQSHRSKQTKDHHHSHNKSKYKNEPVSPGGKLVSFLNSLFNQTSSSKKKKSSSIKDEDQKSHHDLGFAGRRKRRSSISHFPSFNNKISTTSTTAAASISDTKSSSPLLLYSSSLTSGFRTPPPPYTTKPKVYSSASSDLVVTTSKQQLTFPNNNLSKHSGRGSCISLQDQKMINRDMESTIDVLYEKYKKISSLSEKQAHNKDGMVMRMRRRSSTAATDNQHDLDMDDVNGGDSDSSSDLFELQNYDLSSEY